MKESHEKWNMGWGGGGIKGSREERGGEEERCEHRDGDKGGERSVREKTELSERSQNHLGD